jgi:hypothetical protein
MVEPNYNEIVVIPFLQKKYQDAANLALAYEANYLIEKSKNQFLQQKIDELTKKLDNYSKKKKKDELALDGQSF